jgi:hypothetical protein
MCLEVMIHIFLREKKILHFTYETRVGNFVLFLVDGGMEAFHKEQQEKWEACHL